MDNKTTFAILVLILSFHVTFYGQDANSTTKLTIKPILAFQLWGTYTLDQAVFDDETQKFNPVDDRLNLLLHRSRAGIKGNYGSKWNYNFTAALDFVGQDVLAGTVGGTNNGASPRLRAWNAFIQNKVFQNNELLYITFGIMPPQLSRESVTSPFKVGFEKSWSQNYIRRHVTGHGPGRIAGINFGGFYGEKEHIAFNYDLGVHNPFYGDFGGNSAGEKHSPLYTYRVGIHLGDPEYSKYSRSQLFNSKGQREGVTISFSGSYQGASELWEKNTSFGFDLLANYGNFNLSGEWMQLDRNSNLFETSSTTGFVRLGYYYKLKDGKELEPVITYYFFDGPMSENEIIAASVLNAFSGGETSLEFNLNYWLDSKIKLSIAYTIRNGDAGEIGGQFINNNFYRQGGVGQILKGDYLGLGVFFSI
jgi:hypothetical protein